MFTYTAIIEIAKSPALRAPFIAVVATGIPFGISATENKAEIPSVFLSFIGTPITGILVKDAHIPARWAARPAPAQMTE